MDSNETIASLEHQLADFYAGRERLDQALGVSDPDDILSLINNLRNRPQGGATLDKNGHSACLLAIATLYNHLTPGTGPSPAHSVRSELSQAASAMASPLAQAPANPSPSPTRAAAQPEPVSLPAATPPPAPEPVKDISEDRSDTFINNDLLEQIPGMNQEQRDKLDFGIVEVDAKGLIRSYNRYESELAGVEAQSTIGRNFFTQVAPCTNNRLFYGRFKRGVAEGSLDAQIPYTFTYKMRPTNVVVRMFFDTKHDTTFVFVKRR